MIPLEEAAERLRSYIDENPDEKDSHLAYEALDILGIRQIHESRADYTDSVDTEDGDRIEYVVPEEEGDPTICIMDGKVYVEPIQSLLDRLNRAYAEKNDLLICGCCGSFERNWGGESKQDCESCGNWVDAERKLTSEELEKQVASALTNCKEIYDGDGEHVWLCNERMPTHETKKNYSYVFVRVLYSDYWCGRDADTRYWGEICIVNIGMAGKKAVLELKEECGCPDMPAEAIAQELMNRGICAPVVQVCGNSKIEVLQELNKQLFAVNLLGGFYLDRPMNAIGATGWDFMEGDPLAGLKRHQVEAARRVTPQ